MPYRTISRDLKLAAVIDSKAERGQFSNQIYTKSTIFETNTAAINYANGCKQIKLNQQSCDFGVKVEILDRHAASRIPSHPYHNLLRNMKPLSIQPDEKLEDLPLTADIPGPSSEPETSTLTLSADSAVPLVSPSAAVANIQAIDPLVSLRVS